MRCEISAGNRRIGRLVVGLVAGVVAASLSARAIAASGSWDVDASGNWIDGNNWLNGISAAAAGVLDLNGGNLLYAGRFAGAGQTLTTVGASSLSISNTTGTATSVNWDFSGNSGVRTFFVGSDALGTGTVTLALAAGGSVANSGGIVVASGATFDVSAVLSGCRPDRCVA